MNEPYKGFIKKMILTMHKLLDDLKWQIEAGVDDSIGNELNKSIKNERNDVLINKITKPTEVINNQTFDYRINGINTLKELKKFLQSNDICDLQKSSKNLIFSEINNDFKIMIISNIPDTDEDNLGEPIVEKNGELFDKILNAANLS
jgi:DNA polymerase